MYFPSYCWGDPQEWQPCTFSHIWEIGGEVRMRKHKGLTDLRPVTSPLHRQASWYGSRGPEAEQKRREASARAQKQAAANRKLAPLAVDIFATLLPSLPKKRKGKP